MTFLPPKINPRRAFTLIELLISMTLLIILFGMLWGLAAMFSRSFERGENRAERSQLVRSISQILTDDLSCAIQDPLHPMRENNVNSARRFGLSGNQTSMRIDVIQTNPFRTGEQTVQNGVQVPELKTVYYDFSFLSQRGMPEGLTRRELDFETPLSQAGKTNNNDEQLTMSAPEVVGCSFRYYDGSQWRDSWNGLDRNGLPVAIEITLQLMPLANAAALRNSPFAAQIVNVLPQKNRNETTPQNNGTAATAIGSNAPSLGDYAANATSLGDLGDAPTSSEILVEQKELSQNGGIMLSNGGLTGNQKTVESVAEQLNLLPPTLQRVVVHVPTTPLTAQQELRRERPRVNSRQRTSQQTNPQSSTRQRTSSRRTTPRRQTQQPTTPQSPDWIRQ